LILLVFGLRRLSHSGLPGRRAQSLQQDAKEMQVEVLRRDKDAMSLFARRRLKQARSIKDLDCLLDTNELDAVIGWQNREHLPVPSRGASSAVTIQPAHRGG
jgi:hypothetical protein